MKNKLLNVLFEDSEKTCVGNLYDSDIIIPTEAQPAEFYSINPLSSVDVEYKSGEGRSYLKPRRADMNVSVFRNFLFEMDDVELDTQLKILREFNYSDYFSIVYSGGKSYHAILTLESPLSGNHTREGIEAYKRVWKRIAMKIDEIAGKRVCDPACKNPSRFSRFPNYHADGREEQKVVQVGKRMEASVFRELMLTCPELEIKESYSEFVEVESTEEFFEKAPKGLVNALKYPNWVNGASGLYPEAYRICLWAIDYARIPKDQMIRAFEYRVFKMYEKYGYPRHKWMNAINDAYKHKGLI